MKAMKTVKTVKAMITMALVFCIAAMCLTACSSKPQKMTITVSADPEGTYVWEVTQTEELFYISSAPTADQKGDPDGKQVFVLSPKTAGETEVTAALVPAEGGEALSSMTYKIKVTSSMKIKELSAAGDFAGEMDTLPEMPEVVIE